MSPTLTLAQRRILEAMDGGVSLHFDDNRVSPAYLEQDSGERESVSWEDFAALTRSAFVRMGRKVKAKHHVYDITPAGRAAIQGGQD